MFERVEEEATATPTAWSSAPDFSF
jgi:hypothetical protein